MAINERTAYICWSLGGVFGLHHFYLGRDIQAFVWFATFGGGLVGWIRDYWRIRDYVNEANGYGVQSRAGSSEILDSLIRILREMRHPKATWTLLFSQIFLGWLFSVLFRLAVPIGIFPRIGPSWYYWYLGYTAGTLMLGSAIGVYLATNIGTFKRSFLGCCFDSNYIVALPVSLFTWGCIVNPISVADSVNRKLECSEPRQIGARNSTKQLILRCSVGALCCLAYLTLVYRVINVNPYSVGNDGKPRTLVKTAINYWNTYTHEWQKLHGDISKYVDPKGKYHAHWVLGLRTTLMKQGELKSHCRKTRAKWHPDKFRTDIDKQYAENMFRTIDNACNHLKSLYMYSVYI